MTIDIQISNIPNVFFKNDVINFPNIDLQPDFKLAAAGWILVGMEKYDALFSILRRIYSSIVKNLYEYKVWLFIGNSVWQPDTRIVRYRKLWGGLKLQGIEITHHGDLKETVIETNGELKFFGAIQLSELSIESVVKALLYERCTYIVTLPKDCQLETVLGKGWSASIFDDLKFITLISSLKGLIFKQVGQFDDYEYGFVGVGSPDLISKLVN